MADLEGLATTADITKLGELAAEAGLARGAILAWRDLDDPEAGGSGVHATTASRPRAVPGASGTSPS